jgi:hypothetical protein
VEENFTNRTKRLGGKLGIVLCSALLGCTTYGQPSVSVGVSVPLPSVLVVLPSVEIRAESDFYEPLTPYGRWEVVGAYGRCWIPGGVEADWRPYSEGYWQRTDAGWYWVSDEPWAWATYHYGRWNLSAQFGWYWVPQTQWAPAWVSWHSGGGYIGWAPLYPSDVVVISPRAYVFVEERHFMEPVSRSTVVVNSTTIINQTVINEAPATAAIEKASGRKVQAVAVQELRHKAEAPVVARQRIPTSTSEKTVQPPVPSEAQPAEKKAVAAHEPPQVEKHNPVPATPEFKPEAKLEGNNHPPAIKEPTGQNAAKQPVKQEKSAQPSDKKEPQPANEKPAANEQNGPNPADKDHGDKVKE